jgi:serine phosphatase RsbU (regulator of sigma subunit)
MAAAAMGHLQGLVRACVHEQGATPAGVLTRVDTLLSELREDTVASMLQAFLTPDADGWEVAWSSGGHPPLVARRPDGTVELLVGDRDSHDNDHGNDPLLGMSPRAERSEHVVRLPHGSVVVGYTDGLIERRGESIDLGLHRLVHQVGVGPPDPLSLVEHLVDGLTAGSNHDDDIALVAVRLEALPPGVA